MEWHLSKYTMFTKPPDCNFIVAVNLMKNTQTILYPEEISKLINFKELNQEEPLFKKFKKQGLVINYDELAIIQAMNKYSILNNRWVSLTICPTLGCNFDCPYCFENHKSGKMSEETQNKIIDFTKQILEMVNGKGISITWFGGEPLLAPEIIDSLSQKFIEFANSKKIKYGASIITNGYFLNQKNVDMLFKNKVMYYQITLDGIYETHDKTRHLVNGNSTFEVITENLRLVKIPGVINIRHNVYNDNKKEIPILEKLVKNLAKQSGNNINYYSAIVARNPANHLDEQVNYLNEEDSCKITILRDTKQIPHCKSYFCGAETLNTFTIDDKGRLYKCWEDVDKPERSFGIVGEWNPKNPFFTSNNPDILANYLNLGNLFNDEECLNCILLPFCVGNCPSKKMYSYKSCLPYKNNIDEFALKLAEKALEKWKIKNKVKE